MKQLNERDYLWVQAREGDFVGNNRFTKEDNEELFRILRRATGIDKGSSRCGRCVAGARSEVFKLYLRMKDNPNIIIE